MRGVSCFGKTLPLYSEDGWFKINDIGDLKNRIHFIPQMHGGIIFFRKNSITKKVYEQAIIISKDYYKYKFKYFNKPADEPILALAMTLNDLHPIEYENDFKPFIFYPSVKGIKCNILEKKLAYTNNGLEWNENVLLCHWQNVYTEYPIYKIEVDYLKFRNKIIIEIRKPLHYVIHFIKVNYKRVINRLKRISEH